MGERFLIVLPFIFPLFMRLLRRFSFFQVCVTVFLSLCIILFFGDWILFACRRFFFLQVCVTFSLCIILFFGDWTLKKAETIVLGCIWMYLIASGCKHWRRCSRNMTLSRLLTFREKLDSI